MAALEPKHGRELRILLAGLSLTVFVGVTLWIGGLLAFVAARDYFGVDFERRATVWTAIAILSVGGVVAVVLVYVAVITWLLFAKLFFSKSEVMAVANWGPTTRFDRWLVDVIFGRED